MPEGPAVAGERSPIRETTATVAAAMAAALVCLTLATGAGASTVEVEVHDATPFHVFAPNEPFAFDITASLASGTSPEGLAYQWQDFRGNPLGSAVPLALGVRTTVTSPSDSPRAGYYGLRFLPDDPAVTFNESTGNRIEMGFAVLPVAAQRPLDLESPFGLVHADLDDPYISTWIKTMTWHTTGSNFWDFEMNRRRRVGLQELPLVNGDGWDSDDTAGVDDAFLGALGDRFRAYLEADPATDTWELGLEENLSSRFGEPFYFDNLRAKAAAIRAVGDAANVPLRLIYNVAGLGEGSPRAFLASDAAREFQVFAPHPYAWPDFPMPDTWLEPAVASWREEMRRNGIDMPIWFTEIGAPQNDARVAQMFSGSAPVRGQSREEHAAFVVRAHVLALAEGIEKIVWYNYIDRGSSTTNVETHFGLIDRWAFPKPSYAAYVTMTRCLAGKTFRERRDVSSGVRVYEFSDADRSCLVAWAHPESTQAVALSALRPGLNDANVVSVTNTVGTALPVSAGLAVDGFPIFVTSPTDTEKPSVPAHLSATALSPNEVGLSWSDATDNVAVTGYRVYRDGSPVATAAATNYTDSGLSGDTSYTYTVAAFDAVGNESTPSDSATATTTAPAGEHDTGTDTGTDDDTATETDAGSATGTDRQTRADALALHWSLVLAGLVAFRQRRRRERRNEPYACESSAGAGDSARFRSS